jgi:hypothetical protein
MRKAIYILGLFSLAGGLFAADAQQDLSNGTWVLNLSKSKYSPGPPVKGRTITFQVKGDTIEATMKGIDAQGKPMSGGYTATYDDGIDHLRTGDANPVTVSVKRIDAFTADVVQKRDGKVAGTARRVISKDGRQMVNTVKIADANGHTINNVEVYDKQ